MTLSGLNFPFSLRPQSVVKVPGTRRGAGGAGLRWAGRTGYRRNRRPRARCRPGPAPARGPAPGPGPGLPGPVPGPRPGPDSAPGPGPGRRPDHRHRGRRCRDRRCRHHGRRRSRRGCRRRADCIRRGSPAPPAARPRARSRYRCGRGSPSAFAAQRAEHGVLRQPGVAGYLLLPVRELLVGVGDLGIHRREFAVDLPACLVRHVGQSVDGFGAVDGGQPAAGVLRPGGRRGTGRSFSRGGVDIDRDQTASPRIRAAEAAMARLASVERFLRDMRRMGLLCFEGEA